jgi:cytochrome c oxidase subunit 2
MLIRVISEEESEFEAWVANQKLDAPQVPTPLNGKEMFLSLACVNCHNVNGIMMQGGFAPNLTHLMSRDTIASGAAENTPENLKQWLRDPNSIKDGCRMPNMMLTEDQIDSLVEFLTTLK